MRQFLSISLSFFFLIVLCQCKTTQKATQHAVNHPAKKDSVVTASAIWNKCETQRIPYQTMMLSGKMFIDAPSEGLAQMTVNYRIHLKKDSAIWIKMSLFGIEGGRMLITPEKVQILDRQNNRAIIKSLASFKKQIGIEVEFGALQDMILGNPAQIVKRNELKIQDLAANPLLLEGKEASYTFGYFIDNSSFKINKMTLQQDTMQQAATLIYQDFQPLNTYSLANALDVVFPIKRGKIAGNLTHTKVELNPADLSFSFSIPENYTIEKE